MAEHFTGYGMPSVDFGFINQAVNQYDKSRLGAQRERVLSDLGRGTIDYGKASQALLAAGDTEGGLSLARLAESRSDRAESRGFRQQSLDLQKSEATRHASESERDYKFKVEQSREKPSIVWQEDNEGTKVPYLVDPKNPNNIRRLQPNEVPPDSVPGPQSNAAPSGVEWGDNPMMPPNASLAQAGGQQPFTPPPGVNNKEYRKKAGSEAAELDAKTADRGKVAGRVFDMIDQLEEKTKDPAFKRIAGPYNEYGSRQDVNTPTRAAYEFMGARSDKAFLDRVKSDTRAIASEMQRAYLSGQGAVTENERAAIDQIIGNIAASRSPEDAQAQLKNLRGLIGAAFGQKQGYNTSGAGQPKADPLGIR